MSDFNEFINTQKSITDYHLNELESLTGYKLPSDFREHYLIFNGGEPELCLYMYEGSPLVVQEFFPIAFGDERNTVEGNYRELVLEDKIIPRNLLPFGRDPGGDFYCLDMESGRITIFRAEYLPDLNECITEIAVSLAEFLDGLTEED